MHEAMDNRANRKLALRSDAGGHAIEAARKNRRGKA
jgi:hypothetical protein